MVHIAIQQMHLSSYNTIKSLDCDLECCFKEEIIIISRFSTLTETEKLTFILKHDERQCAKLIFNAMYRRKLMVYH